MGWYHYECTDGSCDINKVVPCPDGTCPMPPSAAGVAATGAADSAVPTTPQAVTDEGVSQQQQQQQQHDEEEEEELYDAITPIYHLCQKKLWEQALDMQQPYFPPTFWKDGRFTRASCDKDSLPMTANHYYQGVSGDWLCLQLDPVQLRQLGIPIAVHREQQQQLQQRFGTTTRNAAPIQCLKLFGGIPTMVEKVVLNVFAMQRDGHGYFYGMSRESKVLKNALQIKACLPEQVAQGKRRATKMQGNTNLGTANHHESSSTWRFWQKKIK